MLKTARSIAMLSPLLFLTAPFSQAAQAQEPPQSIPVVVDPTVVTPGICGQIHGLSGRSVILPSGEFVRLVDYCTTVGTSITAVSFEGEEFWQAFLIAASPEALRYAESVGRDEVVSYGATICPVLNSGTSMQELREVQAEGDLPVAFDAAVNVAAVNTYCPQYQSQLGRN
ncbi:DUF732 domain-containing protein [Oscillatoria sp. FACHB-1407]|uniref:DUF732 domain-containing protein n=1 Tax=Oscillatoria sp. FACHB-1407 TaxID=2692847 RepID=UPI0016832B50|nr:DUF732 domain-containing protein [Oscillatoria sp. FACHB-1407]MBD2462898.1 DUF732 domain-containing protein [Oscillatoria sp. FACHB-1407]